MNINFLHKQKELNWFLKNSLFKNSFYLALTQIFNASCGFIFWIIASRLYTIEDVGIATALVSSYTIINYLSRLGIDSSLVKYLPISDKSKVINSYLVVTLIFSSIVGTIYVTGINIFSPSLSFIQDIKYSLIFITFSIFNSASSTTGYSIIAMREAKSYLYQNVILALRIPLLFPLIIFKSFGIFATIGLANIFCTIYSFSHLAKKINFKLKIDLEFLEKSIRFSFGNYVSDLLKFIPELILPIMVLNILGGAEAARYYVAYSIGTIVLIIPESLSISLFVEGSHGENLKESIIKAISITYFFLVPSVLFIYFFGNYMLEIFGKSYIEAFELLRLLAVSSFFVTIHALFVSVQNIRMRVRSIIILNFIRFIILLGISYLLINDYGIIGVGYAWLITYAIISFGVIVFTAKSSIHD